MFVHYDILLSYIRHARGEEVRLKGEGNMGGEGRNDGRELAREE